jgi:hypothetical protein
MLFVITAMDKPNSRELRMSTRSAHFDYVRATGAVRLGGPFVNEADEMIGSLIIIEAADIAEARRWQAADPYVRAGLFARAELYPWKATANNCKAEL